MTRWYHHPRFWFGLALAVVFITAAGLWLRGTQSSSNQSPLSTPVAVGASPLLTPIPENVTTSPPSSWTNGGAVLLWVAMGILLALSITFIILRWYRSPI